MLLPRGGARWPLRRIRRRHRIAVLAIAAATILAVPGAAAADVDITLVIYGTSGTNGWYTSNVTVNWIVTGAADSSGCDAKTLSSDTPGLTLTCSASNLDGSSSVSKSRTFKIDKTPPAATPVPSRAADVNGWYNHPVTVAFAGTDATSGVSACSSTVYSGADSANAAVSGTCTDLAGNVRAAGFSLKYDATAPGATGTPSRNADSRGWYNHPVTVAFSGNDATSGIAGCSSAEYAGPDDPSAAASGSCTDLAGNVGTATYAFKYDATPPSILKVTATVGNRRIDLKWTASSDVQEVQVTRAPGAESAAKATIRRGPADRYRDTGLRIGRAYRYMVRGFDEAGNSASDTLVVTATGPLLSPAPGARVDSPPLLVWTPVKRARYYNVQLLRGRKILGAWPRHAYFRLPRSWVFQGHRYSLRPGVYRWYVWPGFGPISAARYGARLGSSSFVFSAHVSAKR